MWSCLIELKSLENFNLNVSGIAVEPVYRNNLLVLIILTFLEWLALWGPL